MDEMQYTLLTEVLGRWKADIIENFLRECFLSRCCHLFCTRISRKPRKGAFFLWFFPRSSVKSVASVSQRVFKKQSLRAEEIDVVLVEEAVSHITHITTFAPVKIYVPKESLKRAHNLLKAFDEAEDNTKES